MGWRLALSSFKTGGPFLIGRDIRVAAPFVEPGTLIVQVAAAFDAEDATRDRIRAAIEYAVNCVKGIRQKSWLELACNLTPRYEVAAESEDGSVVVFGENAEETCRVDAATVDRLVEAVAPFYRDL